MSQHSILCDFVYKYQGVYAKCPDYLVLCMQIVLIIKCFTCKASLLFSALYAKLPYHVVLYMQSVLIM